MIYAPMVRMTKVELAVIALIFTVLFGATFYGGTKFAEPSYGLSTNSRGEYVFRFDAPGTLYCKSGGGCNILSKKALDDLVAMRKRTYPNECGNSI